MSNLPTLPELLPANPPVAFGDRRLDDDGSVNTAASLPSTRYSVPPSYPNTPESVRQVLHHLKMPAGTGSADSFNFPSHIFNKVLMWGEIQRNHQYSIGCPETINGARTHIDNARDDYARLDELKRDLDNQFKNAFGALKVIEKEMQDVARQRVNLDKVVNAWRAAITDANETSNCIRWMMYHDKRKCFSQWPRPKVLENLQLETQDKWEALTFTTASIAIRKLAVLGWEDNDECEVDSIMSTPRKGEDKNVLVARLKEYLSWEDQPLPTGDDAVDEEVAEEAKLEYYRHLVAESEEKISKKRKLDG